MPSLEEQLTHQFYEWERRGRGWQIWDYPVDLEPPFRPFILRLPAASSTDDGRQPTLLSSFVDRLRGRSANTAREESSDRDEVDETGPDPFDSYGDLRVQRVLLPADCKIKAESSQQLLRSLTSIRQPVTFEIVASSRAIAIQWSCRVEDDALLRRQIQAHFPDAIVTDDVDALAGWQSESIDESVVVDFGLSQEFMRPISVATSFEHDPLIAVVGALEDVRDGETAFLQIMFKPVCHPWAEQVLRAVTDAEGGNFFADAPDMLTLSRDKVAGPLFSAIVRVGARATTPTRAWALARSIGGTLAQFANPLHNEFIPLSNDGYDDAIHAADVGLRQTHRSGMLLNAEELVSLVHLPSTSVRSSKLLRIERRTKAAPLTTEGHPFILGQNVHAGVARSVTLSQEARLRHTYVIGASGTGKSTLLLRMIGQDIECGEGLAVFDPHGDLIEDVLSRIPESRLTDVVLIDPADEEFPVGINILQAHSTIEKTLLSSDLVSAFRRLSTSWGDQMTSVLGNAILAFLESDQGGTLADLRRFLIEPEYRAEFLMTVRDSEVVYYWRKEFPLLVGRPQSSILTRLDTFLRPKLVRNMVCQKNSKLDIGRLMNDGKILLFKLSQGAIGEENAYLLGTLLVSKIHQMAIARQEIKESERRPFYLYLDEFHNFATPSMAAILAGARKYRLGLVLAHQELRQLGREDELTSAVLTNPHTRICFRLGDADAKRLADGFGYFAAPDLQNLSVGEAICRVERAEYDFTLRTARLPDASVETGAHSRQAVVEASRKNYATPRKEVEAGLAPTADSIPIGEEIAKPVRRRVVLPLTLPDGTDLPSKKETSTVRSSEPADSGRGSTQHKYLQQLIKRWAESRGYRVTLEKPVLDGLGNIDVALEKNGCPSIACEISVTTPAEHELGNIQKCLAAGFDHVLMVACEKKIFGQLKALTSTEVSRDQSTRVHVVLPDQVFVCIASLEAKVVPKPQADLDSKELLTAKEVEALLRIDVKTIYSYVQRDMIPYVRMQSNLRFLKSEIMAWVAERSSRRTGKK